MPALIVKLPRNRDFCGELRLIGENGAMLAGPFAVAGRAVQAPAEAAGNATRSPLARFGDTPAGRYRIRAILPSGAGTAYREAVYGGNGIIVLDPCGGDAALAEANGRFHVFIQGGATVAGQLCATNGALRMRDADIGVLCALLDQVDGVECWCVEDAAMACREAVMAGNIYEEGDPPPLPRLGGRDVARRRVLAGGAAMASSVLLPGIFIAAASALPALAQNAYDNNNSDNNGQPPPDQDQDQNQDQNQDQDQNNGGQEGSPDQDNQPPSDQNNNDDNNNDNNNAPKAY